MKTHDSFHEENPCEPLLSALLIVTGLIVATASTPGQAPASKAYLLNVGKGQTFTDIGSDDKTKPELVEDFKELGGKALKVAFFKGDSVGDRVAKVKNWKRFAALRSTSSTPARTPSTSDSTSSTPAARTTTRASIVPINLKPGKNEVNIAHRRTAQHQRLRPGPDRHPQVVLRRRRRKGPTLYFGDIWLEGGERRRRRLPSGPAAQPAGRLQDQGQGRRHGRRSDRHAVHHRPGRADAAGGSVHGDPARLERIRAAKMPKIDKPILFDTPEADAICPPWKCSRRTIRGTWSSRTGRCIPTRRTSSTSIGADKQFRYNPDMGFVLVPPDQKKIDVKLGAAAAESDKGPYPVPDNTPIEGYPVNYKGLTLDEVQRKDEGDSDRHAMVVDPTNRMLYEFYQMRKTDKGWIASGAAIFDLKSNKMRPDGWTSTDAAGLPIFPAAVRYDEIKRGMVEHAMRLAVVKTRRAYVYPATHYASKDTDENLPRMGERIRLKKDFDISGFSPEVQAILKGLKKYGMFVADNGLDWAISVGADPRIPLLHEEFGKIKGSAFEVVEQP